MTNTSICEYSIKTPDDGQYVCPKNVEFFTKIKLRNSVYFWLLLKEYITKHDPLNVKFLDLFNCVINDRKKKKKKV
jgi:hypothetical protein